MANMRSIIGGKIVDAGSDFLLVEIDGKKVEVVPTIEASGSRSALAKMKVATECHDFAIKAVLKGEIEGLPFHYQHRVTVTRLDQDGRPARYTTFMFEKGKQVLEEDDLRDALQSFFIDAEQGAKSFVNFYADNFYADIDSDSKRAEKIYKVCSKSYKKVQELMAGTLAGSDVKGFLNDVLDEMVDG